MFKPRIIISTLALLLAAGLSGQAAPGMINYQGYLEDNGSAITDTLSMDFTIYDALSGGNSKWTETQSTVYVIDGIFNVSLGSSTAIPDTVFNGDARYLEIEVESTALTPRTRIVSGAYSLRVETVDGATGGTVSGNLTAYLGTITGQKGSFGSNNTVSGANTLAAGDLNEATGDESSVCGGRSNTASGNKSTIGGGTYDTASGWFSTVSGGHTNVANGDYAAVSGGRGNISDGDDSFVAGCRGRARHDGTIVLSANSTFTVTDTIATGGVEQLVIRADSGVYVTNGSGQAAYVTNRLINTSTGAYLTTGGTWTNSCDRSLKENFSSVNTSSVLGRLMDLPIQIWNYRSEGADRRHMGPVAQDFYALFGLGGDDKAIATVDADGIALAAIQELGRVTKELENKTARLETMEAELNELKALVRSAMNNGQLKPISNR